MAPASNSACKKAGHATLELIGDFEFFIGEDFVNLLHVQRLEVRERFGDLGWLGDVSETWDG